MDEMKKNDMKQKIKENRYKIEFTENDSINHNDEIVNINGTEISVVPYIKQTTATLLIILAVNTLLDSFEQKNIEHENVRIFESFADKNEAIKVFNIYVIHICTDIQVDDDFDYDLFEETVFWNEIKKKIVNYKEVFDLFMNEINNIHITDKMIDTFETVLFGKSKDFDKLLSELSDIDKEKLQLVLQSEVAKTVKEETKKEMKKDNVNKKKKNLSKMS